MRAYSISNEINSTSSGWDVIVFVSLPAIKWWADMPTDDKLTSPRPERRPP